MFKSIKLMLAVAAVLSLCVIPMVKAGPMPGVEFTFDPNAAAGGVDLTLGYEFTTNSSVVVSGLGIYTGGIAGFNPAPAALWDSAGNLLASTTIQTTDPIIGHFQYGILSTPVTLPGGGDFVVGAYSGNANAWTFDTGGFTVNPSINFVQDRFDNFGGLSFPVNTTGRSGGDFNNGFFGGNVLLGAAVPEPATMTLAGLSLLGMAGYGLRRRKAKAAV